MPSTRDPDTWADDVLHRRKEDPPELGPPVLDNRVPCPSCGGAGFVEGHKIRLTKADALEIGQPEAEDSWYATGATRCEECHGDGWAFP